MRNWLVEYSRYAFKKAKQWIAFIFSIIGFISTFSGLLLTFSVLDIKVKIDFNFTQCICLMCGIVIILFLFCLFIAYINVGVVSMVLRYNPENEIYRRKMAEIDEMRFRGLYVDKQIHEIESAEKSVLLSIHSLSDENKKEQYKMFNKALSDAQARGVEVKVLAPCGRERAIGAYQLNHHYYIEMRFAKQLELEDLRFILVDGERVVFSQQEVPNTGLSSKFKDVQGKELCRILTEYFDGIWGDCHTLNYYQYLVKCIKDLFRCYGDIDLDAASRNLGVPKRALEKAFIHVAKDNLTN